jgi:hypothetical protein
MTIARRPLLASASFLLLVPALARAHDETVQGSGRPVAQAREVEAFDAVSVSGPFQVVVRSGGRAALEVRADDNLLPLIETGVRGDGTGSRRTLHVDLRRHARIEPRTPVVVTIDAVRLAALNVAGSGRISAAALQSPRLAVSIGGAGAVSLTALDAGELVLTIGGSGRIEAAGRAETLRSSIGGSGTIHAEALQTPVASVSIAGSGDAHVHAERRLSVSIAGSGSVVYRGAPTLSTSITGSGRVRKA